MCEVCDHSEIIAYDDRTGLCRYCARDRGVEFKRPSRSYISPDDRERYGTALDYEEGRARRRVIDNEVGRR